MTPPTVHIVPYLCFHLSALLLCTIVAWVSFIYKTGCWLVERDADWVLNALQPKMIGVDLLKGTCLVWFKGFSGIFRNWRKFLGEFGLSALSWNEALMKFLTWCLSLGNLFGVWSFAWCGFLLLEEYTARSVENTGTFQSQHFSKRDFTHTRKFTIYG